MPVFKDFDVILRVANEYFQVFCQEKINLTHLVDSENGNLVAYLYMYSDSQEPIDVHKEMQCINNLLSDSDTDNL